MYFYKIEINEDQLTADPLKEMRFVSAEYHLPEKFFAIVSECRYKAIVDYTKFEEEVFLQAMASRGFTEITCGAKLILTKDQFYHTTKREFDALRP